MKKVLLVSRSYFDALFLENLIDWKACDLRLIKELNAISGWRRISDIRPDILILRQSGANWINLEEYMDFIQKKFLPTNIIYIVEDRDEKDESLQNPRIQVLKWENLSPDVLRKAVRQAEKTGTPDLILQTSDIVADRVNFSEMLRKEMDGFTPEVFTIFKIMSEKKEISREKAENIAASCIIEDIRVRMFQDDKKSFYIVFFTSQDVFAETRRRRFTEIVKRMLHRMEEQIMDDVKAIAVHDVSLKALDEAGQELRNLERLTYFCRGMQILDSNYISENRAVPYNETIYEKTVQIYNAVIDNNLNSANAELQNLVESCMKVSLSFEITDRIKKHLHDALKIIADYWKIEFPDKWDADGAYIEDYLEYSAFSLEKFIRRKVEKERESNQIVIRVSELLLKDYCRDLSVEAISESFGITPAYLSRLFKNTRNQGIASSLREIRLSWAKALMDFGEKDLEFLSSRTGYFDKKYFSRVFHSVYKCTPTSYMKKAVIR